MQIKARTYQRSPIPPVGAYIYSEPFKKSFEAIQIKPVSVGRLLPPGVRQSQAEATIMGRIKAIKQGRASVNGSLI